jgi:hypothetical protein
MRRSTIHSLPLQKGFFMIIILIQGFKYMYAVIYLSLSTEYDDVEILFKNLLNLT